MGRHEAPPLGSQARDATAPPYHGRHRAPANCGIANPHESHSGCAGVDEYEERAGRVADERWSDPEDTHQGGPDDV